MDTITRNFLIFNLLSKQGYAAGEEPKLSVRKRPAIIQTTGCDELVVFLLELLYNILHGWTQGVDTHVARKFNS